MSRGKQLTAKERGKIDAFKQEGYSNRQVAKKIKRSHSVVDNYLKLGDKYGIKKKTGRKSTITPLTKKRIFQLASEKLMSSGKIKAELQLKQTTRTVQRVLSTSPNHIYKKYATKPPLTESHRKARLSFAKESVQNRLDWSKIIWSDEKKFNLDGPDGIRYYWHDIRNEPTYLSKRAFGGGTLMVWGAFVGDQLLDLVVCQQTMDSSKYIKMLNESLVPHLRPGFKFMHDGASIHRSKATKKWLQENDIETIDWPAHSPDLNPIENIWGILVRAVFESGRQFELKKDLEAEVMRQWSKISRETLSNLVNSMSDRIIEVIQQNGGSTQY